MTVEVLGISTPKEKFEVEMAIQKAKRDGLTMTSFAVAGVAAILAFNGHLLAAAALLVVVLVRHARLSEKMNAVFSERVEAVAFKSQVDDLFVFSQDGNTDAFARAAFDEALHLLSKHDNKNEVRVHLALFQDVCVFTSYFNKDGRLIEERTWRDAGSRTQPWPLYAQWCQMFQNKMLDKRARELRGDNTARDWVDAVVFGQICQN